MSSADASRSSDGERIAVWDDSASAGRAWGLAVSADHLFVLRGGSPRLEVWTLDGRQELTDNLDGRLGERPDAASLALAPDGELLVLDAVTPRVLRFRVHFGQGR
jgi:hypothetical protein